jgi:hypothetical protein
MPIPISVVYQTKALLLLPRSGKSRLCVQVTVKPKFIPPFDATAKCLSLSLSMQLQWLTYQEFPSFNDLQRRVRS